MKKIILLFIVLLFGCSPKVKNIDQTNDHKHYTKVKYDEKNNDLLISVNIVYNIMDNEDKCLNLRNWSFMINDADIELIEKVKFPNKAYKKILYTQYVKYQYKVKINIEKYNFNDNYFYLIIDNKCLNYKENYLIFIK